MLKVENVSFSYESNKPLLSSLSFTLKKGTYNVLLGPNGSGKSTIAKLLVGLLSSDSGDIYINGTLLNNDNVYSIRQDIAIVFQNPDNQFIGSTVEDDIAFGLENRCIKQEDMQDIIVHYASKVGMQDYLSYEPSNLSGGQKQRVAIAGALALNPKLLVLDEATSMLDPKGRKEINELISYIRKENKDLTILAITHHMDEAINADNLILLNNGKVIKEGKPSEILTDAKLLENNHLVLPFAMEVCSKLKENGINVKDVLKIEELGDIL